MARNGYNRGLFMEIEGNCRAVLTGCKVIETYMEDQVALRTSSGVVIVYGQNLELGCMTAEGATISGHLQRIEWQ